MPSVIAYFRNFLSREIRVQFRGGYFKHFSNGMLARRVCSLQFEGKVGATVWKNCLETFHLCVLEGDENKFLFEKQILLQKQKGDKDNKTTSSSH